MRIFDEDLDKRILVDKRGSRGMSNQSTEEESIDAVEVESELENESDGYEDMGSSLVNDIEGILNSDETRSQILDIKDVTLPSYLDPDQFRPLYHILRELAKNSRKVTVEEITHTLGIRRTKNNVRRVAGMVKEMLMVFMVINEPKEEHKTIPVVTSEKMQMPKTEEINLSQLSKCVLHQLLRKFPQGQADPKYKKYDMIKAALQNEGDDCFSAANVAEVIRELHSTKLMVRGELIVIDLVTARKYLCLDLHRSLRTPSNNGKVEYIRYAKALSRMLGLPPKSAMDLVRWLMKSGVLFGAQSTDGTKWLKERSNGGAPSDDQSEKTTGNVQSPRARLTSARFLPMSHWFVPKKVRVPESKPGMAVFLIDCEKLRWYQKEQLFRSYLGTKHPIRGRKSIVDTARTDSPDDQIVACDYREMKFAFGESSSFELAPQRNIESAYTSLMSTTPISAEKEEENIMEANGNSEEIVLWPSLEPIFNALMELSSNGRERVKKSELLDYAERKLETETRKDIRQMVRVLIAKGAIVEAAELSDHDCLIQPTTLLTAFRNKPRGRKPGEARKPRASKHTSNSISERAEAPTQPPAEILPLTTPAATASPLQEILGNGQGGEYVLTLSTLDGVPILKLLVSLEPRI